MVCPSALAVKPNREPMTARAIAVELLRLAGHDAGDKAAVKVVEGRVRALLTRRVGIVERVALGQHRKGWRVAVEGRQ
jgi:hypothetical protein